jgi:hypothetical protein
MDVKITVSFWFPAAAASCSDYFVVFPTGAPELLNSEPAFDSLLFQLLELNWELEYEQVNTGS